ncbi:MAG: hemolysin III family protein [Deltaproteobacteria bacterium]|nr:MAG: hemolysin III family protein [Deltaproteobacteria bacterium]
MNVTTVFHAGPKKERTVSKDGSIHVTDEIYNALISTLGTLLALVGSTYLILKSYQNHQVWSTLAFVIYGVCAVNLFLSSALHHAIEGPNHVEEALLKWDYMAIYAMIAGAMTPFCLTVLRETSGPLMLAIMWGMAAVGILLKAFWKNYPKKMEMAIYLLMGWMGAFIVYPATEHAGLNLLICLLSAGIVYSVGAVIYYSQKPNLIPGRFGFHEIWHLFVLTGSLIHYYALYRYIA